MQTQLVKYSMPELPEVENVRRGLSQNLETKILDAPLEKIQFFRKDLRFVLPQKDLHRLKGQELLNLERRGKFLIFNFEKLSFFSHLGMTGHWRIEKTVCQDKKTSSLKQKPSFFRKHDHLLLQWPKQTWVYNDPRRFGYIGLNPKEVFKRFGPDPIVDRIQATQFLKQVQNKKVPIKTWLMDQKNILGVGNIYANEVLFASQIHPLKPAGKLNLEAWRLVLKHTRLILKKSIRLGGSSIKDYRKVDGSEGGFQNVWTVYNKKGLSCPVCDTPIELLKISGRATYFCPKCQPL